MISAIKNISKLTTQNVAFKNKFFYAPNEVFKRNTLSGYFLDPNDVGRRLTKLISLHDSVKNPSEIKLTSKWEDIGVDELSKVEILLEAEQEFWLEFADEDAERFRTVQDVVEYVAKSFYAQ